MYDRAETAAANNVYWQRIRHHLDDGPPDLMRPDDLMAHWTAPDLVLSQTCGLPYRLHLHCRVTLVASPDYGLPRCAPGFYNSVLITRADHPGGFDDLITQRIVINDRHSQSGYAALIDHAKGRPLGPIQISGAHALSARAVAEGHADLAAIDAQSWRLICRFDAFAANLREVARTRPTPALPFITGLHRDPAPLRHALTAALADLDDATRHQLGLRAISVIPASAYLAVPTPPQGAQTG